MNPGVIAPSQAPKMKRTTNSPPKLVHAAWHKSAIAHTKTLKLNKSNENWSAVYRRVLTSSTFQRDNAAVRGSGGTKNTMEDENHKIAERQRRNVLRTIDSSDRK